MAVPLPTDVVSGRFNFQTLGALSNGLDNYYIRQPVASGAYSTAPTDTIIAVTGVAGAVITLPSVATHLKLHKKLIAIVDEGGQATGSPITITPAAGERIDGIVGSYSLNWNGGAVLLYAENDGPGWRLLTKPESAAATPYSPLRPPDWDNADPSSTSQALDRLARSYFLAHGSVPVMPRSVYSTLFLSSSSEYGDIPSGVASQLSTLTEVTVSFWLKRTTAASLQTVFDITANVNDSKVFVRFDAGDTITVGGRALNTESTKTVTTVTTYGATGVWYHIVAVLDPTNDLIDIYVNNLLSISGAAAFDQGTFDAVVGSAFRIGSSAVLGDYFNGNIDQVSMWDRRLTFPAEIGELWNGGFPPLLSGMSFSGTALTQWRMGEGDVVPTVTDQIGANNITLVNTPVFVLDTP